MREMMLELVIWMGVRFRFFLIVMVNSGGNVYLRVDLVGILDDGF